MKLTTADCVKFLCASKHGGTPADWKRRSKRNCPGGVVRLFENVRTYAEVSVYERGGSLFLDTQTPGDGWLFAITDTEDAECGWCLSTSTREYWEQEHCVDDQGCNEQAVRDALESVGLDEVSESTWEPDGRFTKAQTKAQLEAMGFVNDPKFQAFCEDPVANAVDKEDDDVDEEVLEARKAQVGAGFLFAIYPTTEEDFVVVVSPKTVWEKTHAFDTEYAPQAVADAMLALALEEQLVNVFVSSSILSMEETKAEIEKMGFVNDPEFQKFCEEFEV